MALTGRLGVLPAGDDDRLSRQGRTGPPSSPGDRVRARLPGRRWVISPWATGWPAGSRLSLPLECWRRPAPPSWSGASSSRPRCCMPPRRVSGLPRWGAGAQSRGPGVLGGPYQPCRSGRGRGMPGRRGPVGPCGCHDDPGRPSPGGPAGPHGLVLPGCQRRHARRRGRGLLLAIVAAGTADAYRVQGLPHVHLNLLGWVALAVVGTRSAPRGHGAALEDLLLRVSALVEAHPEIVELDCNPCLMGWWWWSTPGSGARWPARRRRWPPAAADRERAMEHGHRRPGTGQVWTGTLVPWSSR